MFLYATDSSGIDLLKVSISSLARSNQTVREICVLTDGFTPAERTDIVTFADQLGFFLTTVSGDAALSTVSGISFDDAAVPRAALLRLFASELVDAPQVLYLDTDTIVLEDLKAIFEINLGDHLLAGVADPIGLPHRRRVGIERSSLYINSGVLLCNLERWRETRFTETCLRVLRELGTTVTFPDQDVLNVAARDAILCLPCRYNMFTPFFLFDPRSLRRYRCDSLPYSDDEINQAKARPSVVHFTGGFCYARPWCSEGSTHPYAHVYRDLMTSISLTPGTIDNRTTQQILLSRIIASRLRRPVCAMFYLFKLLRGGLPHVRRGKDLVEVVCGGGAGPPTRTAREHLRAPIVHET